MPNAFYAVRVGRVPGIYKTWEECQEQTKTFSGAKFKKFKTIQEAEQFIEGVAVDRSKFPVDNASSSGAIDNFDDYGAPLESKRPRPYSQPPGKKNFLSRTATSRFPSRMMSTVAGSTVGLSSSESFANSAVVSKHLPENVAIVYTDGCCHNNGRDGAVAGIGVFWGEDSPHNLAEPLPGRATNNRAEIHAAVQAVLQAKSLGKTKVVIHTDSMFLVNSVTQWIPSWLNNNWKLGGGGQVVNRLDFEALLEAINGIEVEWIHIRGHQGIWGNEEADRLANEGARKPLPPGIATVCATGYK